MKPSDMLSDESKWTKRAMGRRQDGTICAAGNPAAVCRCLVGTLLTCGITPDTENWAQLEKYARDKGFPSLIGFNDHPNTTFSDVHAALLAAGL